MTAPVLPAEPLTPTAMRYAGFWNRLLAAIIDGVLFGLVLVPFWIFLAIIPAAGSEPMSPSSFDPAFALFATGYAIVLILSVVAGWVYFAGMESSRYQATLGKKAVGLRVTDLNGGRISFGRATGRYFGKMLSGMIFNVGYLMAAFTEKKQALHDMLANCLVLKQ